MRREIHQAQRAAGSGESVMELTGPAGVDRSRADALRQRVPECNPEWSVLLEGLGVCLLPVEREGLYLVADPAHARTQVREDTQREGGEIRRRSTQG